MDVGRATSQAGKIFDYISELRDFRNRLHVLKGDLNSDWQAEEMIYINNAIDKIGDEINRLSSELDSLGNDIIITAKEIKREQEARAAKLKAAADRIIKR